MLAFRCFNKEMKKKCALIYSMGNDTLDSSGVLQLIFFHIITHLQQLQYIG